LIAIEADELVQDLELPLARVVAERVELAAEHLDEGVPFVALGVEIAERVRRERVAAIEALDRLPRVDRLLDDAGALGRLGEADRERELLLGLADHALGVAQDG